MSTQIDGNTVKKRTRRTKKEIQEQNKILADKIANGEIEIKKKGKGKGRGIKQKHKIEIANKQENSIRDETVIYIMNKIEDFSELQARDLEIGIFNYTIDYLNQKSNCTWRNPIFKNIYRRKVLSVINNINKTSLINNGDDSLLQKILNNEIAPNKIPFTSYDKLKPQQWAELYEKKEKIEKNLINPEKVAMTEEIVCRRCKNRQITYNMVQLRSADEPMSMLCQCLDCGLNFRIG